MQIIRILAPNPGPFTGSGTNTYIVSEGNEAVIFDPGPTDGRHLDAIRRAVDGMAVRGVLVTHHHLDHSPAAAPLAREFEAPTVGFGFGPFQPTVSVGDGARFELGERVIEILHTPGHTPDSVCFAVDDVVFSGDTVNAGTTVVVEDMVAYMDSLNRLVERVAGPVYPGHGEVIEDGPAAVTAYVRHRRARETQIVGSLTPEVQTVSELVSVVYGDLEPELVLLAEQSLTAHLLKLETEGSAQRGGAGWRAVP